MCLGKNTFQAASVRATRVRAADCIPSLKCLHFRESVSRFSTRSSAPSADGALLSSSVVLQKAVFLAMGLIAGHGVQTDGVNAVENTLFDVGVVPLQAADQQLDLLPLGAAAAVVAHGAVFGEAAGALNELQLIVAFPRQNVVLMDAVQRPDQLHALKIRAVQLGQHGLDLGAVEHPHDRRLNDVAEVVAQGDLVAAQALSLAVQVAPAHPGAEVAGGLLAGVGDLKNVRLKHCDRDLQQPGVGLDLVAVQLIVARVHHQEHQLKGVGTVALEHLHQLGHQHGVLAAGDAHGDLVPGLDQLIVLHRIGELVPDGLAVFFQQALLDLLAGRQYAAHSVLLTCSAADGTRQTAAEIL